MENETFIYEQQAEDSGVEVAEQTHDPSCGSSLFSENEAGSECGSESSRKSPMRSVASGAKPEIKPKPTNLTTKIKRVESMKVRSEINDGRWPFLKQQQNQQHQQQRSRSKGPEVRNLAVKSSMSSSMGPASLTDMKSTDTLDKYGTLPRRKKKELVREPSLNRAATLKRQQSKDKEERERKSLPPYPVDRKAKTMIYHEIAVQTAVGMKDFEGDSFRGLSRFSGNMTDVSIQTDLDLEVLSRLIVSQNEELKDLRAFKVLAEKELEKKLAVEKSLLQQVALLENEHQEMVDFLQAEKSTLSESLLDADDELTRLRELLSGKEAELALEKDKYDQLSKLSEQRREDCLNLDRRLALIEEQNRAGILEQGAAVSSAALALTGLGARLDDLLDQVAQCYKIADSDLENQIFHNDVYLDESPPEDLENRTFVQAISRAIKKPLDFSPYPYVSGRNLDEFLDEVKPRERPKLPKEVDILVEKVVEIDNLVTKLLKMVHLIYEGSQQDLQKCSDKKTELEGKLEVERKCNERLQKELKEVRSKLTLRIQQLEEAKRILEENWQRESHRQYETIDRALDKFNSMKEVVDQYPSLGSIQKQLEDCNFRTASCEDLNANQKSGSIRTTAI